MIMLRGHFLFPRGSFLSFFFFKQCWKVYHFFFKMKWEHVLSSIQLDYRIWMFATKPWTLLLTETTRVLGTLCRAMIDEAQVHKKALY